MHHSAAYGHDAAALARALWRVLGISSTHVSSNTRRELRRYWESDPDLSAWEALCSVAPMLDSEHPTTTRRNELAPCVNTKQRLALVALQRHVELIQSESTTLRPSEIIARILQLSGYLKLLQEDRDSEENRRHSLAIISEDVVALENDISGRSVEGPCVSGSSGPTGLMALRRFILTIQMERQMEGRKGKTVEKRVDAVTVSTIHQSKGLEWPVVYLMRFNDRILPFVGGDAFPPTAKEVAKTAREASKTVFRPGTRWGAQWAVPQQHFTSTNAFYVDADLAFEQMVDIQEERRLTFVAITRAREEFIASFVLRDEQGKLARISRFKKEVPDRYWKEEA